MSRTTVRKLKVRFEGEGDLDKALGRIKAGEDQLSRSTDVLDRRLEQLGKELGVVEGSMLSMASGVDVTKTKFAQLTDSAKRQASQLDRAKSSWLAITAAMYGASRAMDTLAAHERVSRSFATQGLSIDLVRKSTRGLVGDYDLMLARSKAVAFQLDLTDKEFAKLARGAGVLATRTGRTLPDALNRLVEGLGKAETELIDELGLTLRAKEAFGDYAKSIGKATSALTEQERSAALVGRIMKELDKRVGEQRVNVEGLAASWDKMKASWSNFIDVGAELAGRAGGDGALDRASSAIQRNVDVLDALDNPLQAARSGFEGFVRSVPIAGDAIGLFSDKVYDVFGLLDLVIPEVETFSMNFQSGALAVDKMTAAMRDSDTAMSTWEKNRSAWFSSAAYKKVEDQIFLGFDPENPFANLPKPKKANPKRKRRRRKKKKEEMKFAFDEAGVVDSKAFAPGEAMALFGEIEQRDRFGGVFGANGELTNPGTSDIRGEQEMDAAVQQFEAIKTGTTEMAASVTASFMNIGTAAMTAAGDAEASAMVIFQGISQMLQQLAIASIGGPFGMIAAAGIGMVRGLASHSIRRGRSGREMGRTVRHNRRNGGMR